LGIEQWAFFTLSPPHSPLAHCPLSLFYCFSDTPPVAAPQVRSGFTKQFGFVPDDA
jgi:hypothetical protein